MQMSVNNDRQSVKTDISLCGEMSVFTCISNVCLYVHLRQRASHSLRASQTESESLFTCISDRERVTLLALLRRDKERKRERQRRRERETKSATMAAKCRGLVVEGECKVSLCVCRERHLAAIYVFAHTKTFTACRGLLVCMQGLLVCMQGTVSRDT